MIWLWTGETPRYPVPFIPELDGEELDYSHGNQFEKGLSSERGDGQRN